jgi:hypothetical protein
MIGFQGYHHGLFGIADNKSQAIFSSSYDPRVRPWYTATKAAGKLMFTQLFTFAAGGFTTPGISFCVPVYLPASGTVPTALIGITSSDLVLTASFSMVIDKYKSVADLVYLVESSTFYLVSANNGSIAVINGVIIKASASVNDVISGTASFLSNGDTAWKSDGDYSTTINGVAYAVNLRSSSESSATLKWKIVVVNERNAALQTTDYVKPISECMLTTVDYIDHMWEIVKRAQGVAHNHHGTQAYAPVDRPLASEISPAMTGLNQQALWVQNRALMQRTSNMIVSIMLCLIATTCCC